MVIIKWVFLSKYFSILEYLFNKLVNIRARLGRNSPTTNKVPMNSHQIYSQPHVVDSRSSLLPSLILSLFLHLLTLKGCVLSAAFVHYNYKYHILSSKVVFYIFLINIMPTISLKLFFF